MRTGPLKGGSRGKHPNDYASANRVSGGTKTRKERKPHGKRNKPGSAHRDAGQRAEGGQGTSGPPNGEREQSEKKAA